VVPQAQDPNEEGISLITQLTGTERSIAIYNVDRAMTEGKTIEHAVDAFLADRQSSVDARSAVAEAAAAVAAGPVAAPNQGANMYYPHHFAPAPVAAPMAAVVPSQPPVWTCAQCTFENQPTASKCEICEKPGHATDAETAAIAQAQQAQVQQAHAPPAVVFPTEYLCPIMLELMGDPVIAADGHSYERSEITDWLCNNSTSPKTNMKLESKSLTPNHTLKSLIGDFKVRHRDA
jgi:hypothetical protein